jgi:hypothetical protein
VHFYTIFAHGQYEKAKGTLLGFHSRHPLFLSLFQGLFLFLGNKIHPLSLSDAVLLTNAVFYFILLAGIYTIGKILYDKKAGLYAALLFSFSPLVFGTARIPMLELPLAAMVTLGFMFLLKTEHFSSLPYSLLAGVFFALAQMTKETAFLFIVPPLVYYTVVSVAITEKRAQRCMHGILVWLLFLVPVGIICLFPVVRQRLWTIYTINAFVSQMYADDTWYHFKSIPFIYLGILVTVVLLPMIASYLWRIRKRSLFVTLWFLAPLVIFSFFSSKLTRYMVPIVPALSLILGIEIAKASFRMKRAYLGLVALVCLGQFILTFSPSFVRASWIRRYANLQIFCFRHDKGFEVFHTLLAYFKKEIPEEKKDAIIVSFVEAIREHFRAELCYFGKGVWVFSPLQGDLASAALRKDTNWGKLLPATKYVIDVDQPQQYKRNELFLDDEQKFRVAFAAHPGLFQEAARFTFANAYQVVVYKKVAVMEQE